MRTAIPFTLNVVTISKTVKKDSRSDDGTIFPPLPRSEKDLEFKLERDVCVQAGSRTRSAMQFETYLGGMSMAHNSPRGTTVEVLPTDKIWIPSKDALETDMGKWKQEVTFKSFFNLSCAPTFKTEIMSVQVRQFPQHASSADSSA